MVESQSMSTLTSNLPYIAHLESKVRREQMKYKQIVHYTGELKAQELRAKLFVVQAIRRGSKITKSSRNATYATWYKDPACVKSIRSNLEELVKSF